MFRLNDVNERGFSHHKLYPVVTDTQAIHRLFVALKFLDLREVKRMGPFAHLPDALNDSFLFGKREAREFFFGCRMKEVTKHVDNYLRAFSLALSRFSTSFAGTQEFPLSASRILRSVSRISFGVEISAISTMSMTSSSVSLDTRDEGATKPRRFLSSMMVIVDWLIADSIPNCFLLSTVGAGNGVEMGSATIEMEMGSATIVFNLAVSPPSIVWQSDCPLSNTECPTPSVGHLEKRGGAAPRCYLHKDVVY